ncbi:MAG: D-aminoacyl-tRNA deacylase [Balneolaceae bacterium]
MRVVLQRVNRAAVKVKGVTEGSIDRGLLLLVGIQEGDSEVEMEWMCQKILKLRIFPDDEGKMNHSVSNIRGEILVVSQFTLYGDVQKGTRPSFIKAERPELAEPLYDKMVDRFRSMSSLRVESGVFGAMMNVSLVNDGPVTILLER